MFTALEQVVLYVEEDVEIPLEIQLKLFQEALGVDPSDTPYSSN